ncbi:SH3 domain-containing protein [Tropicimonas sp. IMCC6043]|uniref:SH3 domain-containing protein n=1 Tax=Tropicimonas sp. IMCC6043 TaxID=2510645 RepID=UPI0013EC2058|nr:SH3 domain-containing protein [Tropicimonas sp. IMCC6043]
MLGRYVAGTLLILGVAMIVAPDAPIEKTDVAVSRTETEPVALASAEPAAMADAVRNAPEALVTPVVARVTEGDLPPEPLQTGVEAALAEALALDAVEENVGTDETRVSFEAAAATAAPAPEPMLAERTARVLFVTGSRVNVRSGPSTAHEVVGSVGYGDEVELVAYEGLSWARIRMGDGETTGFMSRKFLADELAGG